MGEDRRLLVNARVFTGEELLEDHAVLVADSRIEALLPGARARDVEAERTDLSGALLIPGFVDLQVNGGGGVLFNQSPTVDGLRRIGAAHRRFGTTGFLPTLITDDCEHMCTAAAAVDQAIAEGVPGVLGIHFEGPLLNPERGGAHDPERMGAPDEEILGILTSLKRGRTLVTLAPEIAGTETISRLVRAGVIVSAGHSAADHARTREALAAGLTGFTHLFNAMPPMLAREPGMVAAAIEDPDSWFSIIADGHHVHPAMVRLAVRGKVPGGAVLITDAMPVVGGGGESFELYGERITPSGGVCRTQSGALAGADLDMLRAVNNAAGYAGIDWFEAVRMASLYPARALGLDDRRGRLAPGCAADLLVVDENRNILETWIDGRPETAGAAVSQGTG